MLEEDGRDRKIGFWTILSSDVVLMCWKCGRVIKRREYFYYEREERDNLITVRCVCEDCGTGKRAV